MQTEKRKNYLEALELQDALLDLEDSAEIKVKVSAGAEANNLFFIEVLYKGGHAKFLISSHSEAFGKLIGVGFKLNATINDPVKIKHECINRCILIGALNKNNY